MSDLPYVPTASLRPRRIRGLKPDSLPFKIAQLAVGESMLWECLPKKRRTIIDQVELATNAEAIKHMQFTCQSFHCVDMANPEQTTCAVKITRITNKE